MFGILKLFFPSQQERLLRKYKKIVQEINSWEEQFQSLSETELQEKTEEFRARLDKGEPLDSLLPEAYATVKNACRRFCGREIHVSGYEQTWDMVPYDVQLLGAIAMHYGSIAEMQTGEGKTLTATLPLYLNALTRKPVHLVTVNDYLAKRDCEWVGEVLRFLGITTGALTSDTPVELRKSTYQNDVVYGTASEFGFDYLRDNSSALSQDEQVQRGYYYSIVDEVDSILIDEARTPLIISGPVPVSKHMYDELKAGVSQLVRHQRDFCNAFATEARKVLSTLGILNEEEPSLNKEQEKAAREAYQKLWLVSKGTPRNKTLVRLRENPDIRAGIDEWDLYYYSDQNKEEKHKALSELFIIVDEKASEYELTDKGIGYWSKDDTETDFEMIDLSEKYQEIDSDTSLSDEERLQRKSALQEEDEKRRERAHNLRQLFRAHLLMERDLDYILDENKIVIVDENTGRPQPGRRFSDGLHQAIEAKEGVAIQRETQTYATITLQNFFRMYEKLSGMTGTAITEAGEFKEIYSLQVLIIPTHRACMRHDANDEIYISEREKYNAILRDVTEIHKRGCPILIGTESVEFSEKLSRIFKVNKLPHTVLNAKNHEKEAEIIAHAGRKGAVTIATNMAGRGTDIKLEQGVADLGGLHVIGTSRHHSRRIDRQLRGRCARQGDPGFSKFYVCLDDPLLRLFGSPKWTATLKKLRPPEGEAISSRLLNKSIETAQKRVEQRNYTMRKHTLEYDNVMNKQRQEIYSFRNDILHADEVLDMATEVIQSLCSQKAEEFLNTRNEEGHWNREGLREWLHTHFPVTFEKEEFDDDLIEQEEIEKRISDKLTAAFFDKIERGKQTLLEQNPDMEEEKLEEAIRQPVHQIMLNTVDRLWQEHLLVMDHLRTEVQMRSIAQKDPLMEYKHEAFSFFDTMITELRTEITTRLFRFRILMQDPILLEQVLQKVSTKLQGPTSSSLESAIQAYQDLQQEKQKNLQREATPQEEETSPEPLRSEPKVGRNELCPCGSGKKYKKCCGHSEIEVNS